MFSDLRARLRSLFHRKAVEGQLDEELRFHLGQQTEKYVQSGMTPEEAARRARIELGGVEQTKEEHRDARGIRFLEDTWRDIGYAVRMLRKSPGFTIVAILTLALGIGANTAIFSVVNGILLRPLPYRDSSRLVAIWSLTSRLRFQGGNRGEVSPAELVQIREARNIFEGVTFAHPARIAILIGGESPRTIGVYQVPASFFATNGVAPIHGRIFTADDERPGHDRVAILSYRLCEQEFGENARVIGKTVGLDQELYTIVGVMPADFGLTGGLPDLVWTPLNPSVSLVSSPTDHRFLVWARLRPQATIQQAQTVLSAIAQRVGDEFPQQEKGRGLVAEPYLASQVAPVRTSLLVLLGAVSIVLLIACANLSNLLLARGLSRSRDLAVRSALGATRWRIARGLLVESLLVGLAGGAAGLFCGWCGIRFLLLLAPPHLPRLAGVSMSGGVFLFALGAALVAGVLSGLPAAIRGSRLDVSTMQRSNVRSGADAGQQKGLRDLLAPAEVAMCVVLLSGSFLSVASLNKLLEVKPGFRTDHLLSMAIRLPGFAYGDLAQRRAAFREILDHVRTVPGVQSAGAEINPILENAGLTAKFRVPSGTEQRNARFFQARYVSDAYFQTLGIPILQGRSFTATAVDGNAKFAVINQTLSHRLFGDRSPLGKMLIEELYPSGQRDLEIIGVAGDVRDRAVSSRPRATVYLPYYLIGPTTLMHLFLRTRSEPGAMATAVERRIHGVNADIPIEDVRTMQETVAENLNTPRFQASLFSGFAVLAIILVLVGIYGTVAYSASRRTQEMGIRLALGAFPGAVARSVVSEALRPVLLGIAVGLCGSFALTRLMRSLLYSVSPSDPWVLFSASALMIVVGVVGSYIPARRAMRIDPAEALRHE